MRRRPKRLAFVVNSLAFFVSHRLPIALAALEAGWDVTVIAGRGGSPTMEAEVGTAFSGTRIKLVQTSFRSASLNPIVELWGFAQIFASLLRIRPLVLHTISPKGLIYGGVCARILGIQRVVVSISGRGSLFVEGARATFHRLRMAYELVARFALGSSAVHAVVQNNDDLLWLVGNGLVPRDRITVTYGSGVVVNDYLRLASAEKRRVVILAGRLLKDKGVYEFVEAARILRRKGIQWRFALVGAADYNNPTSVPQKEIEGWVKEGIVEWWGYRADMMSVFEEAGIVCLPSYYGEGMPKVLLEAAAAGRPVVTTDSVGCREAIIPGKTGLLVRAGDAVDTANALETLIGNEDLRIEFARAGRTLAIEKFEVLTVVRQMLNIYDGVMDAPAAASANAA